MAYGNGFTLVRGCVRYVESTVSSTATFLARNPVTLSDDRTLIEGVSDDTVIYGIACNDAADSFPGRPGKCLVEVPYPETVYAVKIQTGVAASALSLFQGYNYEKSGNYLRLDPDSQVSAKLVIVGDEYGNTINSADSSVFGSWVANALLGSSDASVANFAQN